MKSESNRPITLDDLLRLKRAERPPAEFWSEFDRNLRAKQLAALVEKRPWWRTLTLPQAIGRLSHYRLPLGAGAVVAVTFFTLRHGEITAPKPVQDTVPVATATVAKPAEIIATSASASQAAVEATPVALPAAQPEDRSEPLVAISGDSTAPAELSRMISLGGASSLEGESESQSPSARYIAANLAAVQAAEPVATRSLLAGATGFESRAMPARATIDPLQQMTPPGDTRRARLLTAMVSSASFEGPVRTTERVANRIPEERLYDQISRIGARGDRVNLKF